MTKPLNKHTQNSDELFSRLDSNNSEGLDDFEKEALEGFASLENTELAKSLNDKLTSKINEVYLEKKSGHTPLYYLSIAAGLILVVGLSFFFYTFLSDQKQELALSKEPLNEQNIPEMSAPIEESKATGETSISESKDSKSIEEEESVNKKQITNAERFESESDGNLGKMDKTGDMEDNLQQASELANNGPVTLASTATGASEEQKSPGKFDEIAANTKDAPAKPAAEPDRDKGLVNARSTVPMGGLKKKAATDESKKEKSKNEGLAADYKETESAPKSSIAYSENAGAGADIDRRNDDQLATQPTFAFKTFTKAQDYIKSEIEKNEILKANVKEFSAKLTINENGTVTKVKFVNSFKNCATCEKELESILLKMPHWQAATLTGKKIKETIHFVYP